ncbi:MAG TPA: ATP-binding protein [Burkholderiales bacterium]|nr:ATP-binding protein [Burkholderiales bacterium]
MAGTLTHHRLPAVGLRTKLVLAALALLVIPWAGYSYVKAIERLLRENQQQQLVATARGVATALQDRPGFMGTPADGAAAGARAATDQVQLLIAGLARPGLRIWVVDRKLWLVAVAGDLKGPLPAAPGSVTFGPLEGAVQAALRPIYERLYQRPASPTEEFIPNDVVFGGPEIERALDGAPAWRRRPGPGGRAVILSVAHPIWVGESVVGAVVVEENTDAIVSLRNRAMEQLIAVTLIAFSVAALVLLLFASRLTSRLRRLRDEAENAIDSQGRVRALVAGEHARDEIGDLSRSFSTVLGRLAQYNDYLENLAARLTHELRTPIAVVRSSLDNVRMQQMPGELGVYVGRAEHGLNRLETILTRMGEATRLEQVVRSGERERFDARSVVAGCVAGYASAYPQRRFALKMTEEPVPLTGAPDLFAQMLDKLAANAADFAEGETPIEVALERDSGEALLRFSNTGPLLPAEMKDRLFESMVSVRKERRAAEPHLGLGLFIVRQIVEFHGGKAGAANRPDGSGVVFELRFPLAY